MNNVEIVAAFAGLLLVLVLIYIWAPYFRGQRVLPLGQLYSRTGKLARDCENSRKASEGRRS